MQLKVSCTSSDWTSSENRRALVKWLLENLRDKLAVGTSTLSIHDKEKTSQYLHAQEGSCDETLRCDEASKFKYQTNRSKKTHGGAIALDGCLSNHEISWPWEPQLKAFETSQ